tara:strand:- start:1365 stop:3599 length:2235 start_codon:yes stop_codon:yes gene_type:complete
MSNEVVFVFASTAEKNTNIMQKYFDKEYDVKFLSSKPLEKILKKDVDLDLKELDEYKVVCPVGAESLKYVAGLTGIIKYNGVHVEQKYMPFIHPSMVAFKPQYKDEILKAASNLNKVLDNKELLETHDKTYEIIQEQKIFDKYKDYYLASNILFVDTETSSLYPRKGNIIGLVLSTKPHEGYYISADLMRNNKEYLHDLFKNRKCVFHNSKFDMAFLKYEYKFEFPDFEDTMLLHYCLEEAVGTHGLKQLAMRFTDLGDYDRELDEYKKAFCRKAKIKLADFTYDLIPIEILGEYACRDGDGTAQLYNKFIPLIAKNEKFNTLYNNMLKPATIALMNLESNGGPISELSLQKLEHDYTIDIEECLDEIAMSADVKRFETIHNKTFNPNSTKQLQELFFDIVKLKPTKKTATGAWSVDKEVLAELKHPLSDAILDLREKTKLLSTYVSSIRRNLDEDNRLRSGFNVQGTTSGRLSSSGALNYQNLPRDNKDIKKLFAANEGYSIVQCDLGTAEVYYAASLSNDKFLQEAFLSKLDFHSYIAKQIFNLPCEVHEVKSLYPAARQNAKAITFGIMYQAGPAKIAETAEVTVQEAKTFISKYFREASALKTFIDKSNSQISMNAYIYSFFGRKRRLPEVKSENRGISQHATRSGVNFLFQSVASDVNILGLIDLIKWIEASKYEEFVKPFTVVHDSIVAEVKNEYIDEYVVNLKRCLQIDRGCAIDNAPIKVDVEVGPSWGELYDYKG